MALAPNLYNICSAISDCGTYGAQVTCLINLSQGATGCVEIQIYDKNLNRADLSQFNVIQVLVTDPGNNVVAIFSEPPLIGNYFDRPLEILTDGLLKGCFTSEMTSNSMTGRLSAEIKMIKEAATGEIEDVVIIRCIQIGTIRESAFSLGYTEAGTVIGPGTSGGGTFIGVTSGTSGTTGTSGTSGTDGTSGTTGTSGTSGSSGVDGTFFGSSGTSGTSGASGTDGTSGSSGTSGSDGTSGTSGVGTDGTSGSSGTSGNDGTSGTSGNDGTSGTSGTSGNDGTSGTSGASGTSGTSGNDGTSGTSGASGSSGTSGVGTDGTSGSSGTSGNGTSGSSGTSGNGTSGTSGTNGTSGTSFASPYSGNLNVTSGQAWVSIDANGNTTANTTVDWNTGNVHSYTLNAATTTFAFSNGQAGATYILIVRQNSAGSQTILWPGTVTWSTTPIMTAAADRYDIYTFIYDGSKYFGSYVQNYV